MNRINRVFAERDGGSGAFISYIVAGDPSPEATKDYVLALEKAGVDIVELGIPFSDPVADGPTIQAGMVRALRTGIHIDDVLALVKRIRAESSIPLAFMTYYNILYKRGVERFVQDAAEAGVDGLIIPDLPVEEAGPLTAAAQKHNIAVIFLVSPATDDARIKRIAGKTAGFLYLVSSMGVTGERSDIGEQTRALINRVKPLKKQTVPLAVGFGISTPEHVRAVIGAGADAVIVGSAFVRQIGEGKTTDEIGAFARTLKQAACADSASDE